MQISVADRFRPFSHLPGTYFLLPGTSLRFQIFPALLRIHDLAKQEPRLITEIPLNIIGPVSDFTIMQDLEKGLLKIWGHSGAGFFRYLIAPSNTSPGFAITIEQFPGKMMDYPDYSKTSDFHCVLTDRLSLGNSKAQDWELIRRRNDLKEILPLWFRLGQFLPLSKSLPQEMGSLLHICQEVIQSHARTEIYSAFTNLFLAGFEGGLSPNLIDERYQGFHLPPLNKRESALSLLTEGASLIKQLFLQEEENNIHILPVLPSEFSCGRLVQTKCGAKGVVDLEWSKHLLRRMIFSSNFEGQLNFHFQKELKRFRLRKTPQDRGVILHCNEPLNVHAGQCYYFDRLEK